MKLGQLEPVQIEWQDEILTFMVKRNHGMRRRYLDSISDAGDTLDGTTGEKLAGVSRYNKATEDLLDDAVKQIIGIETEDGTPAEWSRETCDELPEEIITDLVAAIIGGDRKLQPQAEVTAEGNAS